MSKDEDWIDKRVGAAKKAHPSVTDGVMTRIKGLLKGKISERKLSTTELAETANVLVADMSISSSPKPKESHED